MSKTARNARLIGLAAACMLAAAAEAAAEGRENPFLPTTTSAEDKVIADRQATQAMIRDMMPEIRRSIESSMSQERRDGMDDIKRQLNALQTAGIPRQSAGGSAKPAAGALKFISCVNGKALYRDTTTNAPLFAKPGSDLQSFCDPQ